MQHAKNNLQLHQAVPLSHTAATDPASPGVKLDALNLTPTLAPRHFPQKTGLESGKRHAVGSVPNRSGKQRNNLKHNKIQPNGTGWKNGALQKGASKSKTSSTSRAKLTVKKPAVKDGVFVSKVSDKTVKSIAPRNENASFETITRFAGKNLEALFGTAKFTVSRNGENSVNDVEEPDKALFLSRRARSSEEKPIFPQHKPRTFTLSSQIV